MPEEYKSEASPPDRDASPSDRDASPSDRDASLPDRIAERYRVDDLLGRGGMGAVYRVFDEQHKRPLALKCLTMPEAPHLQRQLNDMFRLEYRTLHQLSHPSVIRVYDYGVAEVGPYYTMELLGGEDLHSLSPVAWPDVCRYARDVCSSLALLHSRGLLHRDVSPRNVRCEDGHAKLIDFGAMVAMGTGHQTVGTAPLVPPEALDRQHLDGRSDLYAVGATMYFALTGRHAYPTRTLRRLPEFWKRQVCAPSALTPDVPPDLDALVMRLLAKDAAARPRSAAEVMERLNAIAGIQDEEHLHVPSAYLTTPSLLGREVEMNSINANLKAITSGRSQQMILLGDAGVGRSRLIDAAVVEARLEGLDVLRLQASDATRGECAIGPVLLARIAELSSTTQQVSAPPPDPSSAGKDRETESNALADLISQVRAALRRVATRGPVLVAIDDVEALDNASQALLASLHKACKRQVLVLLSIHSNSPLETSLQTRIRESNTLTLNSLSAEQTEALLSSVFGDVPGLPPIAERVHKLSRGNPRATLELAQHLVDGNHARYELGRWVLPSKLGKNDLPQAWTEALDLRFAKLDAEALGLAQLLSFAVEYTREPSELDALIAAHSSERERALDALVSGNVFRVDGHQYGFAAGAYGERLRERVSVDRRAEVHHELAKWLRTAKRDAIEIARCELDANNLDSAIDTLLDELQNGSRWDTSPAGYATVLQRAMAACNQQQRPRRDRFLLLTELVQVGEHMGVANMRTHFKELFIQLRADGVLDDYESLPDSLEEGDRLGQAFALTQERYDATPETQRVFNPVDGLRKLAMTVRQAAAFAAVSMDYQLLQSIPSLQPFVTLSPAIETSMTGTLPACFHLTAGRYEQAYTSYESTLKRLEEPDHAGLDEDYWRWACSALRYGLGQIQAGLGIESALEHAKILEADTAWTVPSWDIRRAYYLRLGNMRDAEACRTRIERMILESGRLPPMVDTSARLELDVAAHSGDLPAARLAIDRIQSLSKLHPGYAPYLHYGPAIVALLCGKFELAQEKAELVFKTVGAGEHPIWVWAAGCKLQAMLQLGRTEEVRERGRMYVAEADAINLGVMAQHIHGPLAVAEARLGEGDVAIKRIDAAVAIYEKLGTRGLNLGWMYEYRARIAIELNDAPAFLAAAEHCAEEYGKSKGGYSLVARYEQLRTEARRAGMDTPSMQPPAMNQEATSPALNAALYSSLDAPTETQRHHNTLELLLRESGAVAGQLHASTATGLRLCTSILGDREPPELSTWLGTPTATLGNAALLVEDDDLVTATATATAFDDDYDTGHWSSLTLGYRNGNSDFEQTGLAVLYFEGAPGQLSPELADVVGRVMAGQTGTSTGMHSGTSTASELPPHGTEPH